MVTTLNQNEFHRKLVKWNACFNSCRVGMETVVVEEMGCGGFSKYSTFVLWIYIFDDMLDINDSQL
jgi:hypothetical protein